MPSDEVARDVARKLRYYMQVERLEEGFDLTGPEIPRRHYETKRRPPVYSGATLHDKSLKAYFRDDSIKHFLRDLSPNHPAAKEKKSSSRTKAHVNELQYHMAQAEFREPFDRVASGQRSPNKAYKLNVKRPRPQSAFPSGITTLRRTTPVSVSPLEAHRLVNTAAKLLVASETVAVKSGALQRSSSAMKRKEDQKNLRLPEVAAKRRRSKRLQKRNSAAKNKLAGNKLDIKEDESEYVKPLTVEDIEIQAVHEDSVKIEQEYKLYVYTGSKRGLAPDVSVKLKLHGKQMESSWIKLTDSLSNKVKFRINQKDVFSMNTEDLGDLTAISVAHNKAAPGCNWLLNKIEVEDTRRGKLYVFNYNDFVPHGKTSAIGMRRIDVSSVKNIGNISTRSTEGPSLRSLEEQASDKSLSSISSAHPVPKKYEEKAAVKSSSSISPEPPIPKKEEVPKKTPPPARKRTPTPSLSSSVSSSRRSSQERVSEVSEEAEADKSQSSESESEASSSKSDTKSDDATEKEKDDSVPLVVETVEDNDIFAEQTPVTPTDKIEFGEMEEKEKTRKPVPDERFVEPIADVHSEPDEVEFKSVAEEEAKVEEGQEQIKEPEPPKGLEPEVVVPEPEPEPEPVVVEVTGEEAKQDTHRSSMSSEEGFLEELNLIKNSSFSDQDKQPDHWMQFGGCTLKCVDCTIPFSDNRYACLVYNRSAHFAGVTQNIRDTVIDGGRYKITAQVKLADSVASYAHDKITCTLHYKLQTDTRFQSMKVTEVGHVKSTTWSYIVGWVELNLIQKNGTNFFAVRLCFDGPEGDKDFLVSNVVLTQEYAEDETRKNNVIRNGSFNDFVLTPQNWKGVGQAQIALSNSLYRGSKQGCMTVERPFAYSGLAQSILDIVEPGRHYSFTAYVRIVAGEREGEEKGNHCVKWILKYNCGDSKGDIAYEIARAEKVDSSKWTKINGELNMTELKTSTGRPVLAATSHKSNRNVDSKPRDQFGQPLEYCTFHFETTLGINLCVAGPRMIDGGKIMKPTIEQQTAEPLSGKSSPSSSDDEGDEKKDSEKESPVVSAPSPKPEMEPIIDTTSMKQREQEQQLKNLHQAIEKGERDQVISLLKADPELIGLAEPSMQFTAAHQAAIHQRPDMLKLLYDAGADFNAVSRAGFMPIHYAAWNNDVQCLEHLRLTGASLNELTVDRHTPLHIAAMRGNKEAVKWLMIKGCVLNYRDSLDRTPADVASLNDHDTISILIAKCVNRLKQSQDIVEIITDTDLSAAVSPMSSLTANGPEILDSLTHQVKSNQGDIGDLHGAIARNDENEVRSILKGKPHLVNLPNNKGETAIHVATINKRPNITQLLSTMGSELAQATVSGLQPIHLAVLSEHIPSLDMLIDLDVDIDAKTPQANTPLHLAAERGLLSSVKWLIDQGAVLNFRNGQRKNPMDLAIEKGHTSIANLIQACVSKLKNGEDVTEILKQYPQSSS